MKKLRGMTWDHERGVAPLLAATQEFNKLNPDVTITWDKRPLKDFEDFPVEILAEKFDIIMVDHPFTGEVVNKSVLIPLDDWLPKEFLEDQAKHSVGASHASYNMENKQWALAVDAASQVSAYRNDLVQKLNISIPKNWKEVFELAKYLLGGKIKVAIPLNPTHSFSSFVTLCANLSNANFWDESKGINYEIGVESLYNLKELAALVHPLSIEMDPIQTLNLMSSTNEIAYVPLVFGYINYSIDGFAKHVITFADIPSDQKQPVGAMLGGVGLAVSSSSKYKNEAVKFAALVGSADFQKGLYFESGGQPGHRLAWEDEKVNSKCNNFFKNTINTIDRSFMRPRFPGYNIFQKKAGQLINHFLKNGGNVKEVMKKINNLYVENVQLLYMREYQKLV